MSYVIISTQNIIISTNHVITNIYGVMETDLEMFLLRAMIAGYVFYVFWVIQTNLNNQ